ncbi:MAG: hypothetical protein IV104_13205 [Acidovorax sp.]|nr:hypothetical protein [Acidovorax sp.]
MSAPIDYQPNNMAIELYQSGQFITSHDWTHGRDGNVNPVLHGQFSTEAGEYFDGYAKPFAIGNHVDATVMLNEVTGWLLARACGLPVPQKAFFIPLTLAELPAYGGTASLPPADENGHILSFVTQAVANTAIRAVYDTELLVKEQSQWSRCDDTITFDEGVANTDRHAFNLLRRASGDFVLIDHGFLLRQPNVPYPSHWDASFLDEYLGHSFSNVLHHNTYTWQGRNAPSIRTAGCTASTAFAEKLGAALRATLFEIAFWSSKLLPGRSASWLQFLYSRTQQPRMNSLMAKRYGVLPL